jgi:hypothetical protein
MLNAYVTKIHIFLLGFRRSFLRHTYWHLVEHRWSLATYFGKISSVSYFSITLIKYMFLVDKYKITERRLAVKPGVFSLCTLSNKSLPSPFPSKFQDSNSIVRCTQGFILWHSLLLGTQAVQIELKSLSSRWKAVTWRDEKFQLLCRLSVDPARCNLIIHDWGLFICMRHSKFAC